MQQSRRAERGEEEGKYKQRAKEQGGGCEGGGGKKMKKKKEAHEAFSTQLTLSQAVNETTTTSAAHLDRKPAINGCQRSLGEKIKHLRAPLSPQFYAFNLLPPL